MCEIKTVSAALHIEMIVNCPNPDCDFPIDILKETDTNDYLHNVDGSLLEQMFPCDGDHKDFECCDVTFSRCKTTFHVQGLEW